MIMAECQLIGFSLPFANVTEDDCLIVLLEVRHGGGPLCIVGLAALHKTICEGVDIYLVLRLLAAWVLFHLNE